MKFSKFCLTLLCSALVSAQFNPIVSVNSFKGSPKDLLYFEDTPNIIYHGSETGEVYFSGDDGFSWTKLSLNLSGKITQIIQHKFDRNKAYILSDNTKHFVTTDAGSTWSPFNTPENPAGSLLQSLHYNSKDSPLLFNSQNPDYILYAGNCLEETSSNDAVCNRQFYYSTDGLKTFQELTEAHSCLFANSAQNVQPPSLDTVLCAIDSTDESASISSTNLDLVSSNDFFATKNYAFSQGGILKGAELLGASDDYIVVLASNFVNKQDKFVYISNDTKTWDSYQLPSLASGSSIQILDSSSSGTVNINIPGSQKSGQLYGSNSNHKFDLRLDSLRQDSNGNVDYESVDRLEGVAIANSITNRNQIVSSISFDNSHTWSSLKLVECISSNGNCELHLHSVINRLSLSDSDPGKYFSSKVPGILLGVGNTGTTLGSYDDADTFISTDGGKFWTKTLNGPHLFEIGDSGSIIVAMEHVSTNILKYSLDFGSTWNEIELDVKLIPSLITTTVDSTSFKFLIIGANQKQTSIALDFSGVYSEKCNEKDFEDWSFGKCVLGVKQTFKRRLQSSHCSVDNLYNEPLVEESLCECSADDVTCMEGYELINGQCVIFEEFESEIVRSQCTEGKTTYTIPNGLVLKAGNHCEDSNQLFSNSTDTVKQCPVGNGFVEQREDEEKDDSGNENEIEGPEEGAQDGYDDGKVKTSVYTFKGKVTDYIYLEKPLNTDSEDETLLALTSQNEVFVTHNQGTTWEEVAPDEEFLGMYVNKANTNHVYLLATNDKVVYSLDGADTWKSFRTPARAIPGVKPLYFHPSRGSYLIFVGQEGCDQGFSKACRTVAYISRSYGKRWLKIQEHVNHCQFIGGLQKQTNPELVICHKQANEATQFKSDLVASRDNFKEEKIVLLEDVIGLAQVSDYLMAATALAHDELRAHVSIDALTWADAFFPVNFHVEKQQAYTTLSGSTKSIFLHITTNPNSGTEFGSIMKSNSNGTSYVVSLDNVNRDPQGYVDFEQMSGLEGVIVVNTVENPKKARQGNRKILKSQITHNDGAQWDYIQPPAIDSEGKKYDCIGKGLDKCSLNLHGYTERVDYRDTFSSQSAVGMMLAVGNVGEKLENYYDGHTFLTKDGGISWKEVKKGVYMWEYGDQGSVIVIVNGKDNTNTISYTTDEGATWTDYKFTDEKVTVEDISTVPTDNSVKFLLFTRVPLARGDKTRVFQLDFSQLLNTPCTLDLVHPDIDDFELWTPKHPFQSDNCLFGHETQYYRKIPGKLCRIGKKLTQPHSVVRNCACTRQDYECDFNYYRDTDGTCRVVPGYNPPDDRAAICSSEDSPTEYFLPTGYRKIPLSTCEGGQEFDKAEPLPCPGKESDFEKRHPGWGIFFTLFVIIIILAVIAFFSAFAYNFFYAKYGEIRLGEEANLEVVDGSFKTQLLQYTGATFITTVALFSQGIRFVTIQVNKVRDTLRSRITGRSSRYTPVSAYIVTEDDEANDFLADSNTNESSYADNDTEHSSVPDVDTGANDLDFSDDDEADLGNL